jgi:hypothetical protein
VPCSVVDDKSNYSTIDPVFRTDDLLNLFCDSVIPSMTRFRLCYLFQGITSHFHEGILIVILLYLASFNFCNISIGYSQKYLYAKEDGRNRVRGHKYQYIDSQQLPA